jgi:CRISPR-associated endoribonuclease Cas6
MRIHIKTTPSESIVPFDHQNKLTGTIHKWIGKDNLEHGNLSLYSFSSLMNGKMNTNKSGLEFKSGSSFFISSFEETLLKQIVFSIQKDPTMFCGLKVTEIIIQETPDLSSVNHFLAASPVLIKRTEGDNVKHYSFNENKTTELLKETLQGKMNKAGLFDETLEISFDQSYHAAKTKVVHYNGIKNKANVCPIIIKGKPETKAFAWNVGIGNSTGIGFGAIK